MRVVIAGAGSVGRSIARELLGHGHEVTLIDRQPSAMRVSQVAEADWLLADACELPTLRQVKTDEFRDYSGKIQLSQIDVHEGWVGMPLRALEEASGARVAYVTRYGDGILPTSTTVLQENDTVHVLMRADASAQVERILTTPPVVEA